jgi:protein-disulfide isomerase
MIDLRQRTQVFTLGTLTLLACGIVTAPSCSGRDRAPPEVAGVDLDRLTTEELGRYRQVLQKEIAPCGGRDSLEQSLRSGACPLSRFAAKFVAQRVEQDDTLDEISERYIARYGASGRQSIDVRGAPTLGEDDAPVTIVIFSDFQCPFCARAAEQLRAIVEGEGDVKLTFLNFPITGHEMAMPAAVAALAAHRQGRFWQLHDVIFENRTRLSEDVILELAQGIGLDVDQLREDMLDPAIETQINREKHQGERLGVKGTPAIFINGRRFNENLPELEVAVQEELVRVGVNGRGAPASHPTGGDAQAPSSGGDGDRDAN